jgi:arginase
MKQSSFKAVGVPIDCLAFEGPLQAVERMPASLRRAGLVEALHAEDTGDLDVRISRRMRDPETGVIDLPACKEVTRTLRRVTSHMLDGGDRPFFIGGCCTMAVGIAAGMRDHFGQTALVYVDGHLDLYDGKTSWQGEMGDMPMAILFGRGPAPAFRSVMGDNPLRPENAYILGYRDHDEALERGSLMPEDISEDLRHHPLEEIRARGMKESGEGILRQIEEAELPFYIHLDLDVMHGDLFPATLYSLPDGLLWSELEALLGPLARSPLLAAVSVGCYDPDMDEAEKLATEIAQHVGGIFSVA